MKIFDVKINEKICIGNTIEITFLRNRSKGHEFGIEAPPNVVIHREECLTEVAEEVKTPECTCIKSSVK